MYNKNLSDMYAYFDILKKGIEEGGMTLDKVAVFANAVASCAENALSTVLRSGNADITLPARTDCLK